MHKRIIEILSCPNLHKGSLIAFARELVRYGKTFYNVENSKMHDTDEIVSGVIVNPESKSAYPIADSIAILLSDIDTDVGHHTGLLTSIREHCPSSYKVIMDTTISRLTARKCSRDGEWNRDEMSYFDKNVSTEELRLEILNNIRKRPLWHLYIPRHKHLLRHIAPICEGGFVLEVGCGNARTISWLLPPKNNLYNYIGIDISWHRLMLAKSVISEGNFIQASAFNLPFQNNVFKAIIGFGVFHHLPVPSRGVRNCTQKLAPGGFLALHEPIKKPRLLRDGSITRKFVERILIDYQHSQHDGEIDLPEILKLLKDMGLEIVSLKYSNSIIRPIVNKVIKHLPGSFANRSAVQMSILIDQMMLGTVCKLSRRFGPHGIYLVAQKYA